MKRSRRKRRRRGDGAVPAPPIDALVQASSSHSNSSTAQSTRDTIDLERKHKIFLSHSGAQKGFVEQLCVDLEKYDRHPFFDKRWDSLPKGKEFPPLIFEAIQQCQVGVIVFSEEYFTRTKWPMLELVAMTRKKNEGFIILPIFFNISHAQCQDSLKHVQWLKIWKKWARLDKRIQVEEWIKALTFIGAINAFLFKDGMSEVKFREDILKAICKYVYPETKWDDSNIKGKERFCKVLRKRIESTYIIQNYGIIVMGLYGVGGIGKTTACKVLCNDYLIEFHGRVCHIELESGSKLDLLQKVLLKLSDAKPEFVKKLEEGECRDLLRSNIHKCRVFLAIDNVSNSVESIEQARTFLNLGFHPGSVVVVTARSLGQLKCLNINESSCLEMQELDLEEARSLFLSQIAGVPGSIDADDEKHVMRCVKHCYFSKGEGSSRHYHPLALKVLGLQLGSLGYDPKQWVEHLNEKDSFNQFQEKEHPIFSVFRESFDKLQSKDQLLFLDAALFSSTIVDVLKGIEDHLWFKWSIFDWLSIMHGSSVDDLKKRLEELKRKSLLEDLGDGFSRISLHELWREFAVVETKTGELKHRRWLWEDGGSDHWREIGLMDYRLDEKWRDRYWLCKDGGSNFGEAFLPGGCWKSLQRMCLVHIDPQSLKGLDFQCYSSVTMLHIDGRPNSPEQNQVLDLTPMKFLRSLVLDFSNPLEDDSAYKVIELESSFMVTRHSPVMNLKGLEALKSLRLLKWDLSWHGEISATCIEEIESLTNLQLLMLCVRHGDKLPNLSSLTSLRIVRFDGFDSVETICGLGSRLTKLQYFGILGASSLLSCPGVGDVIALEGLDLGGCPKLEVLPNLQKLINMRNLDISYCRSMKELPGLSGLINLQNLSTRGSEGLFEFPDLHKLSLLQKLDVLDCPVKVLPGLGNLVSLQEFSVNYEGLENEPSLHKLTKLHKLYICGWSAQGLPCSVNFPSLKSLTIYECRGVDELVGVQHLTSLRSLQVRHCDFKDVSVWSNLTSLEELSTWACPMLERLPGLQNLTRLNRLSVSGCSLLQTLSNIGPLPQLESFKCIENQNVRSVPDLSSNFPRLKQLWVSECDSLLSLDSHGPLTALTWINIEDCRSLKALPDLSRLRDVRYLRVVKLGVDMSGHDIQKLKASSSQLLLSMD